MGSEKVGEENMKKKFKKLEWFTPTPDVLIDIYSNRIIALVWGKIFRYCQMKDGKCSASITRMSSELRITEKTFRKYLRILINDGYIQDLTPPEIARRLRRRGD